MTGVLKSLAKALGGVAVLVAAGGFGLAAVESRGTGAAIFGALAFGSIAFATELLADAASPDLDGPPHAFERLGSIGIGGALIVVGLTFAYGLFTSPATGEYAAASNALAVALATLAVAFGLYIAAGSGDDDAEADESEVEASAEGAEVSI